MQEKELLLKKIFNVFFFKILFICIAFENINAQELKLESKDKILTYLNNIKELSSEFLQLENGAISKGNLFLKNNRFKLEYISPSNIIFIIDSNKAMYYNVDLEEVEYFNPKNSSAEIFYKFFFDKNFILESIFKKKENYYLVENKFKNDDETIKIEVYFENNPLIIRKIIISSQLREIEFNLLDINYNPALDKKFFSMVNPLIN